VSEGRDIFRHVVLFRWQPGTTAGQLAALERALEALPGQVPQIRTYRFGADAKQTAGNFDFAIVADFDDVEAFRAYVAHPAHQKLVAEQIRPLAAERAAVQFRIETP
jgi:antibiotic biosynthesis monooxygenase (ABM) superfamily enzyme